MRAVFLLALAASLCAEDYPYGPDSKRQPGVPQGTVTQHSWTSQIFPGTTREFWVYVPAQYKPEKPACVMIFQDGAGFVKEDGHSRATIVFDNLIHKGEMPVTIGVFINPGVLPAPNPNAQPRFNRSFEYDALGDRYARFLLDEILPEVGKQYRLSSDPNDRAIAGSSSGGIAAFTAAWNRPDAFRRVLSFVGSYVDLRGGEIYAPLIRKTEPKPIRVFLQDGKNDQNIYGGNWYNANVELASALEYSGYDVKFVTGAEGHNMKQGGPLLPDALRWLWRGYPKPIAKPQPKGERHMIPLVVDPASDWELVSQGHRFTEGPAVDKHGNVYFSDIPNNRIHKISTDGKVTVFKEETNGVNGLMFGPDGRLFACQNGRKRIVAYHPDGDEDVIVTGAGSNDIAISATGNLYFTDPGAKKVWFIDPKGNMRAVITEGIAFPNGVRFTPDQAFLLVADYASKWIWSYQIEPDGSLVHGVPFHRLEMPDDATQTSADGMTLDSEGFLYVATRIGIQICDPAGRVNGILNKPQPGPLSNLVFGGADFDWLYVTAGDKVFRRHTLRKGALPWKPGKPPAPRL